jgi:hypothetical protein
MEKKKAKAMLTYGLVETKKAIGAIGDWFAKVDGERLPCVHKFWWESGSYNDIKLRSSAKADELFEAIKELKRVILTDDIPIFEKSELVGFKRAGYIAIFAVDDVEFDANGLRFKFKTRLVNLDE